MPIPNPKPHSPPEDVAPRGGLAVLFPARRVLHEAAGEKRFPENVDTRFSKPQSLPKGVLTFTLDPKPNEDDKGDPKP